MAIVQPSDVEFEFDCDESADTFRGNAMIKAEGVAHLLRGRKLPGVTCSPSAGEIAARARERWRDVLPAVLADDSGICAHGLDYRPGVLSARYGNTPGQPPISDEERNDLLMREIARGDNRRCHYVCNAVLMMNEWTHLTAQATWHGTILPERAPGSTGFGYDPIVWLEEHQCSVAQLSQEQKNVSSHRAQALRALARAAGWIT